MESDDQEDRQEASERKLVTIGVSKYVFDILRGLKAKGDYSTYDDTIRALFDRADDSMKEDISSAIEFLGVKPDKKKKEE